MSNPLCLNRLTFLIMNNKIKNVVVNLAIIDGLLRTLFITCVPFDLYDPSGNLPYSAFGVSQSLYAPRATLCPSTANQFLNTTEHK
jgi:hypothetical protein